MDAWDEKNELRTAVYILPGSSKGDHLDLDLDMDLGPYSKLLDGGLSA